MADFDASQNHERLMNVSAAFPANPQPAVLMQPAVGTFHDPAELAQTAAMLGRSIGQQRSDAAQPQLLSMRLRPIGSISLHQIGTMPRASGWAFHRHNRIHQRQQLRHIMRVGAGERHGQGNATGIRDDVMLRPFSGAIGRIRTRFFAPKTARTLEESTTARDQLRISSSASWSLSSRRLV